MVLPFLTLLVQLAFTIPISLPFNNSKGEGNIVFQKLVADFTRWRFAFCLPKHSNTPSWLKQDGPRDLGGMETRSL